MSQTKGPLSEQQLYLCKIYRTLLNLSTQEKHDKLEIEFRKKYPDLKLKGSTLARRAIEFIQIESFASRVPGKSSLKLNEDQRRKIYLKYKSLSGLSTQEKEDKLEEFTKIIFPNLEMKGSTLARYAREYKEKNEYLQRETVIQTKSSPQTTDLSQSKQPSAEQEEHLCELYRSLSGLSNQQKEDQLERLFNIRYPGSKVKGSTLARKAREIQADRDVRKNKESPNQSTSRRIRTYYEFSYDQELELCKMYQSLSGSHTQKDMKIEELWKTQYPDCKLKGSYLSRKARDFASTITLDEDIILIDEIEKTGPILGEATLQRYKTKPPKRNFKRVHQFWGFGHSLSTQPLFHGACYVCSRLITHKSRKYPRRVTDSETFPIALFYENVGDIPYEADDGSYFVCSSCSNGKRNPLEEYALNSSSQFLNIPDELACLRKPEVSQVALLALFSRTPSDRGLNYRKGQYEHKIGQINALHKDDSRYTKLYTMYLGEDEEIENKSDERVHNALRFLRENNELYEIFFSNYETLFRFYHRAYPGFSGFLPIYGPKFVPQQFYQKKRDFFNREKEGLFLPMDFSTDAELSETAIQHVIQKISLHHIDMTYLNIQSRHLEEKIWPNLFPFGIGGWHGSTSFTRREYAKFRLSMFDDRFRSWSPFYFFMLDVIIKDSLISANYARTVKKGNLAKPLTVESLDEDDPYQRYGSKVPKQIQNTKTFWLNKLYDLIALSEYKGRAPDFFITLTGNDNWPEVHSAITGERQIGCTKENMPFVTGNAMPLQHPYIVVEAFYRRLEEFKLRVLNNSKGPLGEVEDYFLRVEYQKRGGLHAHLVVWVSEDSDKSNVISACMPRTSDPENAKFRELVGRFQIHTCQPQKCYKKFGGTLKKCKSGFPFALCDEVKIAPDNIHYLYRRELAEDISISPYNLEILMMFMGHVNVQFVTHAGWMLYLAKYVSKSEPADKIAVLKPDDKMSEPKFYLQTRMVSSLECIALIKSHPHVLTSRPVIFAPTDLDTPRVLKKKKHRPADKYSTDVYYKNKLDHYLDREGLDDVTYPEFLQNYIKNSRGVYVARQRGKLPVIRYYFYKMYGANREQYFFQLLLKNIPVSRATLNNLLSEENQSQTWLEECLIRQLIQQENEVTEFFTGAIQRGYRFDSIRKIADALVSENFVKRIDVDKILEGLKPIQDAAEAYQAEFEFCEDLPQNYNEIQKQPLEHYIRNFTSSQNQAFDFITKKFNSSNKNRLAVGLNQCLAVVSGSAGTGKSFLLQALVQFCIENEITFKVVAPSGTAAFLVSGQTIHSAFRLNFDKECFITGESIEATLLDKLDVVFCDEFSMLDETLLMRMNDILQNFTLNDSLNTKPFGGKSFILLGDPLQLPPVDKHIYTPLLIGQFDSIVLKECKRQDDDSFIDLLNRCRMGICTEDDMSFFENKVVDLDFLQGMNPTDCMILTAKHDSRQKVNDHFIKNVTAEEISFIVNITGVNNSKIGQATRDIVIERHRKKIFAEVLSLKVGMKVMLLRNLDVSRGFVNGCIGVIERLNKNPDFCLFRSLATNTVMPIQRVTIEVELNNTKFEVQQLPLTPAYAVTIHKAQGMSLDSNFISCKDIFTGGMFYTAVSRVKNQAQLFFLDFEREAVYCDNHYRELWNWLLMTDVLNPDRKDCPLPYIPWIPRDFKDVDKHDQYVKQIEDHKTKLKREPTDSRQQSIDETSILNQQAELKAKKILVAMNSESADNNRFVDQVIELLADNAEWITVLNTHFKEFDPKPYISGDIESIRSHCLPTELTRTHVLVSNNGNGNCFYHSVCIALCGHAEYPFLLRLLGINAVFENFGFFTEYAFSLGIDDFQSFIVSFTIPARYGHIIPNKYWSTTHHAQALAIALNVNIHYCRYFPQFKNNRLMYLSQRRNAIFCPLQNTNRRIKIYFNSAQLHFLPILARNLSDDSFWLIHNASLFPPTERASVIDTSTNEVGRSPDSSDIEIISQRDSDEQTVTEDLDAMDLNHTMNDSDMQSFEKHSMKLLEELNSFFGPGVNYSDLVANRLSSETEFVEGIRLFCVHSHVIFSGDHIEESFSDAGFSNLLEKDYALLRNPGNGNCAYNSYSLLMFNTIGMASSLRLLALATISNNRTTLEENILVLSDAENFNTLLYNTTLPPRSSIILKNGCLPPNYFAENLHHYCMSIACQREVQIFNPQSCPKSVRTARGAANYYASQDRHILYARNDVEIIGTPLKLYQWGQHYIPIIARVPSNDYLVARSRLSIESLPNDRERHSVEVLEELNSLFGSTENYSEAVSERLVQESDFIESIRLLCVQSTIAYTTLHEEESFANVGFSHLLEKDYALFCNPGNGNCAYNSYSLLMFNTLEMASSLRLLALNTIIKNRQFFERNFQVVSDSADFNTLLFNTTLPSGSTDILRRSRLTPNYYAENIHHYSISIACQREVQIFSPQICPPSATTGRAVANFYRGCEQHILFVVDDVELIGTPLKLIQWEQHYLPIVPRVSSIDYLVATTRLSLELLPID